MSDYHLEELYAGCTSALVTLGDYSKGEDSTNSSGGRDHRSTNPYYTTHPAYSGPGDDLHNVTYAYVQICYVCSSFDEINWDIPKVEKKYGWAIASNWTPPSLTGKLRRGDSETTHQLFADMANGPHIFTSGSSLVGCWLIFSTLPSHRRDGNYSLWSALDGGGACPNPDAKGGTLGKHVVYTSPVISIEGQLKEWPTFNRLYADHVRAGGKGDDKAISNLTTVANKYAFRLRKYLYGILCPCHTCEDIDKGTNVAFNNCVPCVCKHDTTSATCWDPNADNGTGAWSSCPPQDDYNRKLQMQCVPCQPLTVHVAHQGKLELSTFCPDGQLCRPKMHRPTLQSCMFGGILLPVFDPTCMQADDARKLIDEVNSLVVEAKQFRMAYLNHDPDGKITIRWYEKKIGGLFPGDDRLAGEEVWEKNAAYAPWTDKVKEEVKNIKVQFKPLTTICLEPITITMTLVENILVQKDPPKYRPTTLYPTVVKLPEICECDHLCQAMELDTPICLCDPQCLSAKEMHSLLAKVSLKLEELLQSMCIPYRMVGRKTFSAPTSLDPTIGDGGGNFYTVTCAEKKCLTEFPKNCNCIHKPADGTTYTDNAIFKCQHSIDEVVPVTHWEDIPPYESMTDSYTTVDSDCCSHTWPCVEDWFGAGHTFPDGSGDMVTKAYYNTWLYKGWQMMGQISLSDYIKKYFGFSWNPVPACCHGTDCLGQWHFEVLWRVTQALLRGHYDQYQGGQQQMNVIYRFGMCGPPDCGGPPWTKTMEWSKENIVYHKAHWDAPSCSANPTIKGTLPVAKWTELGLHGKMSIEGTKYWLKRSAKPYNRSYMAINVPEPSDAAMVEETHAGLSMKVDPTTSSEPIVQFQRDAIMLIASKWHMRDSARNWDPVLLERALLSGKGVPSSDINTLLVSFVVDGLLDYTQLNEIIAVLHMHPSPRIYTLLLNADILRDKALRENDNLAGQGMVANLQAVEDIVKGYMEDTLRLGNALMTPDILYDHRQELSKAFAAPSAFLEVLEESTKEVDIGCTSCRLNRIKKDLYEAFIKDVHSLSDDDRMHILNHWAAVLPGVATLRVVSKLKYRNVGRHELVPLKYREGRKIVLCMHMAIGDVLAATAAVRTLKGRDPAYRIWVETSCPELWDNNPLVERGDIPSDAVRYVLGSPISQTLRTRNTFVQEYWKVLALQLGLEPVLEEAFPHADLYLDRRERSPAYVKGKFGVRKPYWIVVCGYKADHPLKHWGAPGSGNLYQKVIDLATGIQWVQMGLTGDDHHTHIPLERTLNLLGQTNHSLRDMLALVYHADGILCPITCYHHVAAAFPGVRCVTVGGAREPLHFIDYSGISPLHRYMHSIGKLPCSSDTVCRDPGTHFRNKCSNRDPDGTPMCMKLITPTAVAAQVQALRQGASA